jgi:dihydrofolate synthase/folylpolyglutamate synthase
VNSTATGLADWLALLERRHADPIQLGLERVAQVRERMRLRPDFPLLSIAGTNGKGSTCAYLHAILGAAGYRVGLYTSPHLLRYNERVRVGPDCVDDAEIVASLEAVEAARGDTPLTYFEHATLAAMAHFCRAEVDVAVLEVGLGGRLDAVNLFDADCAVVTAVDLDHMAYLGTDRETIAFEKAGIFRAARPAICSDRDPPGSLIEHAHRLEAPLWRLGADFTVELAEPGWLCRVGESVYPALPKPALRGRFQLDNAAGAIAALHALRARLPVTLAAMRAGIAGASQPGRFQIIGQQPLRVLDVAHNPHAARALAGTLAELPRPGRTLAVLAMLADKDIEAVVAAMRERVDAWYLAPLPPPRGAPVQHLAEVLARHGRVGRIHADVHSAWRAACQEAGPADTIIAFGSFLTVADILELQRNDG